MKKKIIIGISLVVVFLIWKSVSTNNKNKTTYETVVAEKGSLINSISGSGSITAGNNATISTRVSGVVSAVYVTNGDTVKKGQKIAMVTLDEYAQERQLAAWVDYLNAAQAVKEATNNKSVADIAMWKARNEVLDAQTAEDNNDGSNMIVAKTLDQKRLAFTVAESKYLNANANIAYARAKVAAALRNYQENSATIVAPEAGIISDLALAPGLTLTVNSSTSNTSGTTIVSVQTVGKISSLTGQLMATIDLSEMDILKVKAKQKVSLSLDAYPEKTFTGKVLSVNTTGSKSSGVTNYPVAIILDPVEVPIYTNMAVSAQIITNIKTDVILIPSSAINGTTVQVIKNNKPVAAEVRAGESNDTQTEILTGLAGGDVVVTATIDNSATTKSTATTSPFGGGNVRWFRGSGF